MNILVEQVVLVIDGLEVEVHVGCSSEERARLRAILFDMRATVSAGERVHADGLEHVVDYTSLVKIATDTAQAKTWHLLETIASDVGGAILDTHPTVSSVTIRVRKSGIVQCQHIGVEMIFRRNLSAT